MCKCVNGCVCDGFSLSDEIQDPNEITNVEVNGDNTITITLSDGSTYTSPSAITIPDVEYPAFSKLSTFETLANSISVSISAEDWVSDEADVPSTMILRFFGRFDKDSGDIEITFDGSPLFSIPADLTIRDCNIRGEIEIIRATNLASESALCNAVGTFHISPPDLNAESVTIVKRGQAFKDLSLGPYNLRVDQTSPIVGETTEIYSATFNVIQRKPS